MIIRMFGKAGVASEKFDWDVHTSREICRGFPVKNAEKSGSGIADSWAEGPQGANQP